MLPKSNNFFRDHFTFCLAATHNGWEIIKNTISNSFHSQSDTSWSVRIDVLKLFANHLLELKNALDGLGSLNFTAKTKQ